MAQKNPADTDATEDYTRKKLNNIAYWKRQEDEYFLSYFMIAGTAKIPLEILSLLQYKSPYRKRGIKLRVSKIEYRIR